jgi:2-keto-4-pentenoate hydratase/2-oxohepta-3-ene-1,7-dioic acid hydratase in catechol pathway
MRLVSFRTNGQNRLGGRATDGSVIDLNKVSSEVPSDIVTLLEGGETTMAAAAEALSAGADREDCRAPEDLELLPVVPRPPKILCVARNYAEHAAEANLEVLKKPNIFIRFPRSLIADGEPIQVPRVSAACDWEAELAVVIGKGGRHIPEERALEHVAGYTIFNDVSIRDWQLAKPPIQFGAGKNFDASGPLGPDLVTADEIADPNALKIELVVNDTVMQSSNTASMIFNVQRVINFVSTFTTLEPGDVLAMGTPSGVGHFREPPVYLVAGDTVRIEIEGLGVQENPVIDEAAA